MSSKKYTVSEISRQTGDSTRQVQRKLKELINTDGNKYLIDEKLFRILYPATERDNDVAELSYDVVEGFSSEEYAEFQKRLIEYPRLKEDLEYHRKSAKSHQKQMEMILTLMNQRNLIEGADKGYIPQAKDKN